MKACPYRKDFYLKLGSDPDRVQVKLKEFVVAFERLTTILEKFYVQGGHDKGPF
jgi:hypothetical protein